MKIHGYKTGAGELIRGGGVPMGQITLKIFGIMAPAVSPESPAAKWHRNRNGVWK